MHTTAIIRDRGQLTIPDKIRSLYPWMRSSQPVNVIAYEDRVEIVPHKKEKKVDWKAIWDGIKQSRSYKGKNKISLSDFVIQDRQTRR